MNLPASPLTIEALRMYFPHSPRAHIFGVKKRNGKIVWRLVIGDARIEADSQEEIIEKMKVNNKFGLLK